jgi:hypothetical protein
MVLVVSCVCVCVYNVCVWLRSRNGECDFIRRLNPGRERSKRERKYVLECVYVNVSVYM